jgi:outer membrane protein
LPSVIGAGIAYLPEYAGSRNNRVSPAVFGEHTFSNGIYISTLRGLGFDYPVGDWTAGIAFRHSPGRTDSAATFAGTGNSGSSDLKGMGDIHNFYSVDLHASVLLGDLVTLSVASQQALNHRDNGSFYKFSVSVPNQVTDKDRVVFSADIRYDDADYAMTFFGVSATQSKNSGYQAHVAAAGFEYVGVNAIWTHTISKNWRRRTVPALPTCWTWRNRAR